MYIGFGSIVVDDPDAMTRMIFDAVKASGVRALVSKGWGGLGADDIGVPEGVFMLGNVPHDWLFERVSAVVHHGGAGTTAAGIKAGKPTAVVPFFGDQPFWGAMIARAKAGPDPVAYKNLTSEKLAESIKFCLKPETVQQAKTYGEKIREEKGTDVGGQSFHDNLDIDALRCTLAPSRTAIWRVRKSQVRLSGMAAAALVEEGHITYSDLKLYVSQIEGQHHLGLQANMMIQVSLARVQHRGPTSRPHLGSCLLSSDGRERNGAGNRRHAARAIQIPFSQTDRGLGRRIFLCIWNSAGQHGRGRRCSRLYQSTGQEVFICDRSFRHCGTKGKGTR